jgi:hypothetical protein
MGLDVPASFRIRDQRRFAPFPPRGPRGTSSPASTVLRSAATACLPLTKLCCLALAIPPGTSVFSLPAAQTADRGPGVGRPVSGRNYPDGEVQALPGSWRTLVQLCSGLRLRRDRHARPLRRVNTAPRHEYGEGYPRLRGDFGAQSPGFTAGCLRFVGWVAPPLHARLASGCWPRSAGWD